MKTKFTLSIIPFAIIFTLISITWITLIYNNLNPTYKHLLAVILVILNLIAYLKNYLIALGITGIIILLGVFSLISFNVELISNSFTLKIGSLILRTPQLNKYSVLILIIYIIINRNILKKFISRIFEKF